MGKNAISSAQDIYLEQEEAIYNSEEVVKISLEAEKYPFIIAYHSGEKETIVSKLKKIGCNTIKQLDFANCVVVSMSKNQLKAIKTLESVESIERDYDYKVLSKSTTEKKRIAYLAGEDSKINMKKEVKMAIFDTSVSNISSDDCVSFINSTVDKTNDHGAQMVEIISTVISDKEKMKVRPHIYSVAVADHRGFIKTSAIMEALNWSIENKIKIISMSFGDYHKSKLLERMVNIAAKNGILLIAAAGNDGGFREENRIMYPAAFNNVLSVGATVGEEVARYSNGGMKADCFASGTYKPIDFNGNTVNITGTSVAAAYIAGEALEKWCVDPNQTAKNIAKNISARTKINLQEKVTDLTKMTPNGIVEKKETVSTDSNFVKVIQNDVLETSDYATSLCCSDSDEDDSYGMATAINIPFFSWETGCVNCPGSAVWYKFAANVYEAHPNGVHGWYRIQTQGSLDTVGYLYDSYGNQIGYDDDSGNNMNLNIMCQLEFGEAYYIQVRAYGDNTGSFSIKVDYDRDDHGNTPETATEVVGVYYEDQSVAGYLRSNGDVDYYTFVSANSCVMEIYTEGDTNTYGKLFCVEGDVLDSDDNSNGNGNFKITAHLEKMKRYYIAVSHNSPTGYGEYTLRFKFVKDCFFLPSDYYSAGVKPILAWYNNSYTNTPSFGEMFYSIKYHMYMNKASALLWRDKFLQNKSLADALMSSIEENLLDETVELLAEEGIQSISMTDVLVDIVVDCIIKLLTPYIDRAFFNEAYENMHQLELLDILYSTVCIVDRDPQEGELSYTYMDTYNFNTTNGYYVYGEPSFRGTWIEYSLS